MCTKVSQKELHCFTIHMLYTYVIFSIQYIMYMYVIPKGNVRSHLASLNIGRCLQ